MMNDTNSRDVAAVRVFPPLVPLAAGLAGIGLSKVWPVPLEVGEWGPLLEQVGDGVIILGVALCIWAIFALRRSGQDPSPNKPTPVIIATGPFRFTRNPIYLGMVIFCLGLGLHRVDFWILLLTPVTAWILQRFVILAEEEYLEAKFGAVYLDYKERVRRWI